MTLELAVPVDGRARNSCGGLGEDGGKFPIQAKAETTALPPPTIAFGAQE